MATSRVVLIHDCGSYDSVRRIGRAHMDAAVIALRHFDVALFAKERPAFEELLDAKPVFSAEIVGLVWNAKPFAASIAISRGVFAPARAKWS